MGLKHLTVELSELGREQTLRNDSDFIFNDKYLQSQEYYSFEDLFTLVVNNSVPHNNLFGDFNYVEISNTSKIGDVHPVRLNFNIREKEDENYYKKIEKGDIISAQQGDILLSKIRPNLKKFIFIDHNNQKFYYTSAFIHLRPKKLNKIFFYCFRTVFYSNLVSITRQGKGYPTLREEDIINLKFNKSLIDSLERSEDRLNSLINSVETKLANLKEELVPTPEIINGTFAREFGFSTSKLRNLSSFEYQYIEFKQFSNNRDLRQGARFHRKSGEFVVNELKKLTDVKIKDFLNGPIVLGESISPSDYDDGGEQAYISMANIKNWKLELAEAKRTTANYAFGKENKMISKGDILFARSGEGTIGKLALVEESDPKAIFADFIMRIRLRNIDSRFVYYYFRTNYFQYLVEINKKGLGNNTNIFPSQIQEFPLITPPKKEQKRIVLEISQKIKDQESINEKITKRLKDIEDMLYQIVSNKIHGKY